MEYEDPRLVDVECLLEKSPPYRLKQLYLPVDPENEPKLYKKQDFNRPFLVKTSDGKVEKIKEGKWHFLLKYLPQEIWYIILEFKFEMEKYDFLESVFYDQLEEESCAFRNLSQERKLQIIEKEKVFVSLPYYRSKGESFNSRYYSQGSIMDRFQYDMDMFDYLESRFLYKITNIGNSMLDVAIQAIKIMKKWFFMMDRAEVLMSSYPKRNYNKESLVYFMGRFTRKIDEMYCVTRSVDHITYYFNVYADADSIDNKKMCRLMLHDFKYVIYRFNICCTYFDSPPICHSCRDFKEYFYEFEEWSKGLTPEIAEKTLSKKDDHHYFNPHWMEKDENDEYLIMVLKREGYYN